MSRRRIVATSVLGVLGSTLFVGLSTAAEAASLPGRSGAITLWDDHDYQDRSIYFLVGEQSENLDNLGFGDKASSLVNKTSRPWFIYEDDHWGGAIACVRPNSHVNDLNRFKWGDKISSIVTGGGSTCGPSPIGDPN